MSPDNRLLGDDAAAVVEHDAPRAPDELGLPARPELDRSSTRSHVWQRAGRFVSTYLGVGGVLLGLCVYLGFTQDPFFTVDNLLIVLETEAVTLVVAVGLTFVLLLGGIDLSLGGTMAITGVVLFELVTERGVPAGLAAVIVVVMATALGLCVNGVLIGKVRLSFLVVTLGTASLYRGIALIRTEGQSKSLFDQKFLVDLGANDVFGVPILVVIALTVLVVGILVLRYTGFGRMVYAVGGNAEAARLAGINVTGIRIAVFGISAGLAGLASVMQVGRLTSASPTVGTGIELVAGAAVLLGGTSFMGGKGTLFGTLLGVLFLGVLSNGITLAGVSSFWQGVVSGIVLIAALLLDRARQRGAPA